MDYDYFMIGVIIGEVYFVGLESIESKTAANYQPSTGKTSRSSRYHVEYIFVNAIVAKMCWLQILKYFFGSI